MPSCAMTVSRSVSRTLITGAGACWSDARLSETYAFAELEEAETLVALGGDGFMLHTLHRMLEGECPHLPVFGMNRGTVGFLMNEWRLDGLADRIAGAKAIRVAPLEMRAKTVSGQTFV